MKKVVSAILTLILLCTMLEALGEERTFDPLQTMILTINPNTTQADIEEMIGTYNLPYTLQKFNSHWGQIMVYKIAYNEDAAKQKRGKTDDHIEVKFSKKTGQILYASYFNVAAFYADYHKNYEVQVYFEEGYGNMLGCYGFNASFEGYGQNTREIPFNSVTEALDDVLWNASQYHPSKE